VISVIIPAFNEERSIGLVIKSLPQNKIKEIIVVNNGSTDKTAYIAKKHGARVVDEAYRGYGAACLKGISEVNDPEIVVFVDGDFSDFPEEIENLVKPIIENRADFVLGSRMIFSESRAALLPQARYGNLLAVFLIRFFFRHQFTDLGPFRAIRYKSLEEIHMVDKTLDGQLKCK